MDAVEAAKEKLWRLLFLGKPDRALNDHVDLLITVAEQRGREQALGYATPAACPGLDTTPHLEPVHCPGCRQ